MPRLTSCPKLIITSGTYLHATRTLPGSTYIPNSRGSLITHVKFQLPSADATFLDVMAGFDMCSRYLLYCTLPVPYPYRFLSGWMVLLEHADLIIMIILLIIHMYFSPHDAIR